MIKSSILKKLIVFIVNLISKTWKIKAQNFPKEPSVIVFWHKNMLPIWKSFEKIGAYAVVSLSSDGEILSKLLTKWGFNLIRGSSSKGGKEVLHKIQLLLPHSYVLITPDGPRGPKCVLKPGAVISSIRTGSPLFVCKMYCSWFYSSRRSWDNFIFPLPFAKIIIEFIGPFVFKKTEDRDIVDSYLRKIENILNS